MKTQVIQDHKGNPAGVFIPIEEWNQLKHKYPELENTSLNIPSWQQEIVLERIKKAEPPIDAFKMIEELEAE